MSKQITEKRPVIPSLRKMEVGERVAFPLSRMNCVKTSCTIASVVLGWRFSTHVNREQAAIEVTRKE